MTLFPVVERELRVASRRSWTYWGRSVFGLAAVALTAWVFLVQAAVQFRTTGQHLFGTLSFLGMVFVGFSGVTYTADCLSSEKREGTLGLLFLTDLTGFDVTFGKLAATSLGAFYGLLALLPVMALGLLLGGVTAGEFLRMVLVLVSTLMLSLAAGVAVSVVSRDPRRASSGTFLLLLAVFALGPFALILLDQVLEWRGWSRAAGGNSGLQALSWMTPVAAYNFVDDGQFKLNARTFWKSEAWIGILALGFLGFASFRLPRSWQDKGRSRVGQQWGSWLDTLRFPTPQSRLVFRRSWLDTNPGAWLSGRYWLRSMFVWAVLIFSVLGFVYGGWRVGSSWWNSGVYLATSILLHLVIKVWIANEAPRQFSEDRRSGALELLLTTPFSVSDTLAGRRIALLRQFGLPVAVVLGADAVFLVASLRSEISGGDEQLVWALMWIFRMVSLPLDGVTLFWLGLWKGMTSAENRTVSAVISLGLVLPILIAIGVFTVLGVMSVASQISWVTPGLTLSVWVAVCLANSVFWVLRARRILFQQFRELAQQRSERSASTRGSWWRSFLGRRSAA